MAYSYSDITFLENPFSFSVALKTSLEPLRTIFPWWTLVLHLGSGQCPFNQEKCLRRCGNRRKENKIGTGSLTLTLAVSFFFVNNLWPNCSCWHYRSLSIGRGMIMLYPVITKKKRRLGSLKANRSYPFYLSDIRRIMRQYWTTFFKKICFLIKGQQKIGPMTKKETYQYHPSRV